MRTVITISLNGNAYQLDAVGYDALRAYLQVAEQRLAGNPDQAEILADLEQAIADKCNRYLGPHKNVVSADEVAEVIREMGPVDGGAGEAAAQAGGWRRHGQRWHRHWRWGDRRHGSEHGPRDGQWCWCGCRCGSWHGRRCYGTRRRKNLHRWRIC